MKSGSYQRGAIPQCYARYLLMQITDIVTSLASGMPGHMVAIQQGGQLRDSFGGVGNALKAMLSMVTPAQWQLARRCCTDCAKRSDYFTAYDEINKAIIRTGNIAGTCQRFRSWLPPSLLLPLLALTVGTVQSLMTELLAWDR